MNSSTNLDEGLEQIAAKFKANVDIKDRKYRLKTYKQCFVGSEAVDYLVTSGMAASRVDAVQLGKAMVLEFHLFEHVTRDHPFQDSYKFYRFVDGNERGGYKLSDRGTKVGWSEFLGTTASSFGQQQQRQPAQLPLPDLEAVSAKDTHVICKLWPLDEHNTRHLDHVHPPQWQDPDPHDDDGEYYSYDLVVIGAGPGGLVTAAGSAGVGAKVALIEAHMLGGDCLNVGCVPSKTLIHAANLVHSVRGDSAALREAGIHVDPAAVTVDFSQVMKRVRKVRADLSHHDSAERFSQELGVQVFLGYATFSSESTIDVNGKTLHFKRAVIATGGYPSLVPIPGLQELHSKASQQQHGVSDEFTLSSSSEPRPLVMTNETLFNMTQAPNNLVVIGAGVIGLEMAQALQRLGVNVTVLGRSGRILPKEDEDLTLIIKEQMEKDGVRFRLHVLNYIQVQLIGRINKQSGYPEMKLTLHEQVAGENRTTTELVCDGLLVAAGRRPNVTGLNLETAKVEYDTKRGLLINDKLQTSNPRVYGVGDCCDCSFKFTHAADFMARTAIRNALFFGKDKLSSLLIPYATFTSPEIASVGLYERDLNEQGIEFRIFEKQFEDNDRAVCDGQTKGLVRFRVCSKTDTILGASIVGAGAGNMIGEVTLAMQSGTGLGGLASVIHPYPTTSEAIRQAGDIYNKTRLTTTVKMLLRGIVSLQR